MKENNTDMNIDASEGREPAKSARFFVAMKRGFIDVYDRLGYIVGSSVIISALVLTFISVSILLTANLDLPIIVGILIALPGPVAGWLVLAGIYYYAFKHVLGDFPTPSDTYSAIKKIARPALQLLAIDTVITVVIAGDAAWFFVFPDRLGAGISLILGIIFSYITLMWFMMLIYHLPLLVFQTTQPSGPGPLVIIKKSYLLMAHNPIFTLSTFLVIIAFATICSITVVGFFAIFIGASAFLLTHFLRELLIRYGILEEPEDVSG